MGKLLVLVLLAGCVSSGTTVPVNERPMYGGVFKTATMRLADEDFVAAAKKRFPTARAASDHYAELGWQFLGSREPRTAIKRFNQCWLLDATNANCFWGFGTFEIRMGHTDQAIEHLEKARAMMPSSVSLQVDLATGYAQKAQESTKGPAVAAAMLEKANAIFEHAAIAEPTNQKVFCVWAMILAETGSTKKACEISARCQDDRDGIRARLKCP